MVLLLQIQIYFNLAICTYSSNNYMIHELVLHRTSIVMGQIKYLIIHSTIINPF